MDLNSAETQQLLQRMFERTKESCVSEMSSLKSVAKKGIAQYGNLSNEGLEELHDLTMYVTHCLTSMIETGRLIKDLDDKAIIELEEIRNGFLKQQGKLSVAVLLRQYRDNQ